MVEPNFLRGATMRTFIVISGEITEGFTFYGPFKTFKKAEAFGQILDGNGHYDVVQLQDPMK